VLVTGTGKAMVAKEKGGRDEMAVSDLKRIMAPYNPRRMAEDDMASLVRSLEKFGQVEPVIVNKRTNRLVGGHQRVLAAEKLGMKTMWVFYVDLDEKQEKALNLALNKIVGDWDTDKLESLLKELSEGGLLEFTGFSPMELEAFSSDKDFSFEKGEHPVDFMASDGVKDGRMFTVEAAFSTKERAEIFLAFIKASNPKMTGHSYLLKGDSLPCITK
jgi:hypothetical protein